MLITQEFIQYRHDANYVKILKLQEDLFHFHNRSTLPLNYHLFESSINATSFKLYSKIFSCKITWYRIYSGVRSIHKCESMY